MFGVSATGIQHPFSDEEIQAYLVWEAKQNAIHSKKIEEKRQQADEKKKELKAAQLLKKKQERQEKINQEKKAKQKRAKEIAEAKAKRLEEEKRIREKSKQIKSKFKHSFYIFLFLKLLNQVLIDFCLKSRHFSKKIHYSV